MDKNLLSIKISLYLAMRVKTYSKKSFGESPHLGRMIKPGPELQVTAPAVFGEVSYKTKISAASPAP
jgi:hypothetical protein